MEVALNQPVPKLPEPGEPVTVSLDQLPEFLKSYDLEMTRADKDFIYVRKRETNVQGDQNGSKIG